MMAEHQRPPGLVEQLQARWPRSTLEYVRLIATTLLALVLVPLALLRLFRHPDQVLDRAISSAVR